MLTLYSLVVDLSIPLLASLNNLAHCEFSFMHSLHRSWSLNDRLMERVQSSLKSIKKSCYLCEFLTTRPALSACNRWWTLSDKFAWHGDREFRKLDSIQQAKMRQSLKTWLVINRRTHSKFFLAIRLRYETGSFKQIKFIWELLLMIFLNQLVTTGMMIAVKVITIVIKDK